jgi:N-methylhydantoinase A
MHYYIGTDIGGTFTDCVLLDDKGTLLTTKVPSTPPNFAVGLMNGLTEISSNISTPLKTLLKKTRNFAHGCTVATNTLINQSGARVGVITTKGFEETLYMMRGSAYCQGLPPEAWCHKPQNTRPFDLVPRDQIVGITERVDKAGETVVPLNEDEVREAAHFLVKTKKCETIAVFFLWSFRNPQNEKRAGEIILDVFPELYVDLSHEVLPMIGEYERGSTTALNCYLRPETERYMMDLHGRLETSGFQSNFYIMQANGGLVEASKAPRHAVRILQSGPTGGVIAAKIIGERIGSSHIITGDMGGTSFDISLITDGDIHYTTRSFHSRHAVATPMVDVESIGAGGGSIAYVDMEGLKVGPQSAGAVPGPACYARGGNQPTVTDANLTLGYLNPDYFLGGKMKLDRSRAEKAIQDHVAEPLGMTVIEAANGIHRIVNAHMADAIRFHVFQRGYDPRDFDLFMFGGATPVHGVAISEDLGTRSMIVPLSGLATVFSAFGISNSDILRFYASSSFLPLGEESMERLQKVYEELTEQGRKELVAEGVKEKEIEATRIANMRYHLQLTDIEVRMPDGELNGKGASEIAERFDRRYAELYGESAGFKEAGRDIISQFVQMVGKTPKGLLEPEDPVPQVPSHARKGKREAYFASTGGFCQTEIYDGDRLRAGNTVTGPAILEMTGTTVVIPPGYQGRLDTFRNIHLEKSGTLSS